MTQIVQDFAAFDRAAATYAPTQIGRTRYLTPEGFLLCEGVRIARTGPMLYRHSEIPTVSPAPGGAMTTVLRDADVLFAPDTIASFSGRPVTNDHPPTIVTPENFQRYVVGVTLNPRRGEGVDSDYLVADLLIQDAAAIAEIGTSEKPGTGKREISAGYEAEVEEIKPGLGRQTLVVGNHVAFLRRGRAGPACAIMDKEPNKMATRPKITVKRGRKASMFDGLRRAFLAKDADAFESELDQFEPDAEGGGDDGEIVIRVEGGDEGGGDGGSPAGGMEERVAKLEAAVTAIAAAVETMKPAAPPPVAEGGGEGAGDAGGGDGGGEGGGEGGAPPEFSDGDGGEGDKGGDDNAEEDKTVVADAMAKAEILAPGVKLPIQDSANPKRSAVRLLRVRALDEAIKGPNKAHVESVLAGRKPLFDKMPRGELRVTFDAAAAVIRAANNAHTGGRVVDIPQGHMTAAKYQDMIKERRKRG